MINMWLFWAVLSTVLTALTVVFAKAGVTGVNSNLAAAGGTAIMVATVALVVIFALEWRSLSTIPLRSWIFFTLMAVADVGAWICYFRALKLGDAARVAAIDKFSVVLVAVLSIAVLGEKLKLSNWFGIALIACGAAFVALN